MGKPNLVHLHLHTDSSFLDGIGRADEYAALAKQYGMRACAITDHGGLHGLPDFRRAMTAAGIKPLYGCEFYLNARRDEAKEIKSKAEGAQASGFDPTLRNHHQLLIAANRTGWLNLLKLNHDAVRNGYYYYPRTTVDLVLEHADGLFCTTTCTTSLFSRLINNKQLKECRRLIARFKEAFGDRFFFELQPWDYPEQCAVNRFLAAEMIKAGVEPVLTCDVHYALPGDKARQDEALAIARNKLLTDPDRFVISTQNHFYSADEAIALYVKNGHPGGRKLAERACANTEAIADRCDADIYSDESLKPPQYRGADGKPVADAYGELKRLAIDGFKRIVVPNVPRKKLPTYKQRLIKELRIIDRCQMSHFYLVTMDVVHECSRRKILAWVRGSGCASLVAACLQITRQDPMRHDLLFERFIDPSRPNAPDFDLDIDAARRQEIIDFVTTKYGGTDGSNIARIVAIQTYGLKMAVQRVLKAHGVDPSIVWDVNMAATAVAVDKKVESRLATCVPNDRRAVWDDVSARIIQQCRRKDTVTWIKHNQDLLDAALCMVGRRYGRSKHAAGYVVTPTPVIEHLPIDRLYDSGTKAHVITTAWGEGQASTDISPSGLMKLDLLGLDTMTVVSNAVNLASKRHKRDVWREIDSWTMDFADPKVAAEFASGRGMGLHQLSEVDQGLAKFSRELRPKNVEAVRDMVALYRPGAIQFLEHYRRRAHGQERPDDVHPLFDALVADTHGIIVYQEQIMHILNKLGGIELRKAYGVIKAIGKKKLKDVQAANDEFIKGAAKHGMSEADARAVLDVIEMFAGYGFNKAHSASYAELSWVTAYLRAYYPVEFWICLLNATENKSKRKKGMEQDRKIEVVMRQAQASGLVLRSPAIGLSGDDWYVSKSGALVAPLSLIRDVGGFAGSAIREAYRREKWPDVFAFLQWCESHRGVVNSAALKQLARANAFRTFKIPAVQAYDLVVAWAGFRPGKRKGTQTEQLKGALAFNGGDVYRTMSDDEVRMAFERTALGFNAWHNPWITNGRADKVAELIEAGRVHPDTERRMRDKRRPFLVTAVRPHTDKKGGRMAFVSLATIGGGTVKAVAFSRTWARCNKVRADNVYLISGTYDNKGDYIVANVKRPFVSVDSVG